LKFDNANPSAGGSAAASERRGPATPVSERKSVKFFQMSSRLGDVSVQPVMGGVNGAQVSVGF
jgi:hypothetical protein